MEDSKGNLWFGTDGGGVSKYDGEKFTSYTTNEGLADNTIISIYEDSKGNIWLGTKNAGVSKFDGKKITNYNVSDNLVHNAVWSILEDKQGNIWLGTGGAGLIRLNELNIESFTINNGLISNHINAIAQNNKGDFWIATESGLNFFDGKHFRAITTQNGLPSNKITTIVIDNSENIWLGTKDKGIIKMNVDCYVESQNDFSLCFTNFTVEQGLAHNRVFSITEDAYANLWIGTYGGGVSRYNGDAFFIYTTQQGLPQNRVWSTLEDNEGNIWFGTNDKGVSKFDGANFITYTTLEGLANNTVWAIYQDKYNYIWFGTEGGGISKFDGNKFTNYTTKQGLIHNDIRSITQDADGNMWFGSNGSGLSKFNGEKFQNFTEDDGLAHQNVRSMLTSHNGTIWFGTNGGGVSVYDGNKFTNYSTKDGLPHTSIKCLLEDAVGNIWLGTSGGGAVRFDGVSFLIINTTNGLADDVVYDMIEDDKGVIWFGTNLGFCGLKINTDTVQLGIGKLNLLNKNIKTSDFTWENYNNKTGYPIKDLNTNSMTYTIKGLPKSKENTKGIIWGACGDDKVVRFNLGAINRDKPLPKLVIQKVKVNEENISWNTLKNNNDSLIVLNEEALTYGNKLDNKTKSILFHNFNDIIFSEVRKWYPLPEKLLLPSQLNNISFDFLAIETERNFLVKYQYALLEYESNIDLDKVEWSPLSSKTSANYNNLWEGKYTFLVKAIMPEGNQTPIETYHFNVLPPWWRLWWMYFFYGVAFLLLMFLIVWWNGRRLAVQAKKLTIEVQRVTKEISEQKKLVEDKHSEILDSITYAKRIQQAILPNIEEIKAALPQSFVYYQPKDVVAGDFYWFENYKGNLYIASADCTGHGVPGAMVSVICSNALNKALLEEGIEEVDEILNRTRELVIERLIKGDTDVKDGMDISLLKLNTKTRQADWAGANNPLYIINANKKQKDLPLGEDISLSPLNKMILTIKADRQPIGISENLQPFTKHVLNLQEGDQLCLFTDGYADQFGGKSGKKLGYKVFREKLVEISNLDLETQKEKLSSYFEEWKDSEEQVDDICIVCVKI